MRLAQFIKPLKLADRQALAAASGTTYQHLRNIAFSSKSCGVQIAVDLEAASNRAVMRWDLRPDDWHRIWPELIGAEGAPAVLETQDAQ